MVAPPPWRWMRQFGGPRECQASSGPSAWWGGSGPSGLLETRLQALALDAALFTVSGQATVILSAGCEVLCPWLQPH